MRASRVMILEYITMMGVPLLLFIGLVVFPFHAANVLRGILALVAVGAIVYGAIGLKDVFIKGGKANGRKN